MLSRSRRISRFAPPRSPIFRQYSPLASGRREAGASAQDTALNPWWLATLTLPVVTALALSTTYGLPVSDWPIAREAGEYLVQGNLDVYVEHPEAQMGPLALLLAALLPSWLYSPFVGGLLLLFLVLLVGPRPTYEFRAAGFAGAMLLAWPWAALAVQGHGDDAIVLVGLAAMLSGHGGGKVWRVVAGFLIAISAKPTAVLFLPLLLLTSRQTFVVGVVGAGAIWGPIVLADPSGFLAAGHGHSDVLVGSLPALMGIEPMSGYPAWVRPVQLGLGLGLCWWLGAKRGWAAAILGVVAVRTVLEPAPWNYYSTTVLAAALMYEASGRRRFPTLSVLAFASYVVANPYFDPLSWQLGLLRLTALLALVAITFDQTTARFLPPSSDLEVEPGDRSLTHEQEDRTIR